MMTSNHIIFISQKLSKNLRSRWKRRQQQKICVSRSPILNACSKKKETHILSRLAEIFWAAWLRDGRLSRDNLGIRVPLFPTLFVSRMTETGYESCGTNGTGKKLRGTVLIWLYCRTHFPGQILAEVFRPILCRYLGFLIFSEILLRHFATFLIVWQFRLFRNFPLLWIIINTDRYKPKITFSTKFQISHVLYYSLWNNCSKLSRTDKVFECPVVCTCDNDII